MQRLILLLAAIVAAGLAGWSLHARVSVPGATAGGAAQDVAAAVAPETRSPDAEIASLRARLDDELAARLLLESELERLREDVQLLAQDVEELEKPEPEPAARAAAKRRRPRSRWLDSDLLAGSGLGQTEIDAIGHAYDSIEMDKLELSNRSTREGWRGTSRFRRESADLQTRTRELRSDLGEERYDWLLFATGQPNRVEVQHVLATSPAANTGVKPGDLIVSYDDTRVFTQAELVAETTQGRAGDMVALELLRDGEPQVVYVPRGPLGIQIGPRKARPEPIR